MQPLLDAAARAAVGDAMRRVADAEIRPRFRALADGQIHLKGPGDYVTEADLEAELALTPMLRAILDVPVVGEEAASKDASVEDVLATDEVAWTVDPVDGTANFVAGSETYAVMVGLVEAGRPVGGWILQPETGHLYEGLEGVGAFVDGRPLPGVARTRAAEVRAAVADLPQGAVSVKYAADEVREGLIAAERELGDYAQLRMCAGFDYTDLVTEQVGYLVYTRAKAWDHVPGAAIAAECGYTVGRVDGSGYVTAQTAGAPLLAARTDHWESIREVLARHLAV
ncbi:inositol monophosphatase [Demequina sp. SYSU T00039]|uniref:Inositol monophosphatase n=1 Tax=Demequina lignilytica TaxID=3051663 RepID=A0AAW7M603_9MICO|nr:MULTISPECIES: inositol monophosphatase [unclassified Demequina]MDN4478589.1 inositol monophosphatase [Demequina sp. SYSU T00039-1]MDN4488567.1 inositol monophosphatase [Demequina sp. SYSU T00039]MDN4491574.1 inositol monophosphatase [Demequina sp. SYSU T00068]